MHQYQVYVIVYFKRIFFIVDNFHWLVMD